MTYQWINVEKNAHYVQLSFDHHAKRNPLSLELLSEFKKALMEIPSNDDTIIIHLSSAGADLSHIKQLKSNRDELGLFNYSKQIGEIFQQISELTQPTVGVAHDYVYGGALGVLLACDLCYATKETRFCLPEISRGILPAQILYYLNQRLSPKKSLAILAESQVFSPQKALEWQLIDQVFLDQAQAIDFIKTLSINQNHAFSHTKKQQATLTQAMPETYIEQAALSFSKQLLELES